MTPGAAPTKTCGGCVRCCEIVPVAEIGKGSYTPCAAQRDPLGAAGPGCHIYANRPRSCRDWSCLWLTSPDLPDELRPDRCGLVIDPLVDLVWDGFEDKEQTAAQVWVSKGHEDDFAKPLVTAMLLGLLEQTRFVLWRLPVGPDRRSFARAIGVDPETGNLGIGPANECTMALGSERERFDRVDHLMTQGRRP